MSHRLSLTSLHESRSQMSRGSKKMSAFKMYMIPVTLCETETPMLKTICLMHRRRNSITREEKARRIINQTLPHEEWTRSSKRKRFHSSQPTYGVLARMVAVVTDQRKTNVYPWSYLAPTSPASAVVIITLLQLLLMDSSPPGDEECSASSVTVTTKTTLSLS